uniref:Uncharacterized protein n=1 Tax=viral metagenome TaxID=1070528 RepID=A0A2V0RA25_9ZZZZ
MKPPVGWFESKGQKIVILAEDGQSDEDAIKETVAKHGANVSDVKRGAPDSGQADNSKAEPIRIVEAATPPPPKTAEQPQPTPKLPDTSDKISRHDAWQKSATGLINNILGNGNKR